MQNLCIVFYFYMCYNFIQFNKIKEQIMKLTSDNQTLAEKKALILYILDKVSKPISNDALLKLAITIDNMNYFYFQQFLLDLLENKYIINYIFYLTFKCSR